MRYFLFAYLALAVNCTAIKINTFSNEEKKNLPTSSFSVEFEDLQIIYEGKSQEIQKRKTNRRIAKSHSNEEILKDFGKYYLDEEGRIISETGEKIIKNQHRYHRLFSNGKNELIGVIVYPYSDESDIIFKNLSIGKEEEYNFEGQIVDINHTNRAGYTVLTFDCRLIEVGKFGNTDLETQSLSDSTCIQFDIIDSEWILLYEYDSGLAINNIRTYLYSLKSKERVLFFKKRHREDNVQFKLVKDS